MKLSLLVLIFLFNMNVAHAGPGASGGGKGVVCRNSSGAVTSAELLEFWEAREIHQLKIQPPQGSLEEMLDASLAKLSSSVETDGIGLRDAAGTIYHGSEALFQVLKTMSRQILIPSKYTGVVTRRLRNVHLTVTEDSYEAARPSGCAVEQIVRYDDSNFQSGLVLINEDLYERLDIQNQAALLAHEALYKWLRDTTGETSSLRTRRAIGLAFSGHGFSAINLKDLPNEYYVCETRDAKGWYSKKSKFYITALPSKAFLVQGVSIGGLQMIDNRLITQLPDTGATLFTDFKKLPVSRKLNAVVLVSGMVQPEIRASITIDRSVRGQAIATLAARPSIFFPNGLTPQKAICVLKTKSSLALL